jgi:hypothetical protein
LLKHELRLVEDPADWEAWHAIRERVLWEARGEIGVYDRDHPSLRSPAHFPFLLVYEGEPIGAVEAAGCSFSGARPAGA